MEIILVTNAFARSAHAEVEGLTSVALYAITPNTVIVLTDEPGRNTVSRFIDEVIAFGLESVDPMAMIDAGSSIIEMLSAIEGLPEVKTEDIEPASLALGYLLGLALLSLRRDTPSIYLEISNNRIRTLQPCEEDRCLIERSIGINDARRVLEKYLDEEIGQEELFKELRSILKERIIPLETVSAVISVKNMHDFECIDDTFCMSLPAVYESNKIAVQFFPHNLRNVAKQVSLAETSLDTYVIGIFNTEIAPRYGNLVLRYSPNFAIYIGMRDIPAEEARAFCKGNRECMYAFLATSIASICVDAPSLYREIKCFRATDEGDVVLPRDILKMLLEVGDDMISYWINNKYIGVNSLELNRPLICRRSGEKYRCITRFLNRRVMLKIKPELLKILTRYSTKLSRPASDIVILTLPSQVVDRIIRFNEDRVRLAVGLRT